jgi:hypothetical protein
VDEVPLRPEPDEEAPVPSAVLVCPRPAVAPPTAMLEELPERPLPAEEPPVPKAALADPFPAVAAPTPRVEELPEPLRVPLDEPPVPMAVLALPLPAVEAPAPTVDELCANAMEPPAISIAAADDRSRFLVILILSRVTGLDQERNEFFSGLFRVQKWDRNENSFGPSVLAPSLMEEVMADNSGGGNAMLGVIVGVLLVLVVGFFVFNGMKGGGSPAPAAKISVTK